jgi:hypothetical protein
MDGDVLGADRPLHQMTAAGEVRLDAAKHSGVPQSVHDD